MCYRIRKGGIMGTLSGKYAIVTGAGKGIGEAIVKRFLEEDIAGVAMFEWNMELCEQTAAKLDPTGRRLFPVQCNVADREQVKAGVEAVIARFGTVDILVNNAGITRDRMFHKMSDEEWDAVINVNLNGMYNLCRTVTPLMREKGYGRVVNISSTSAWGNAGQCNYAATKAAVHGFTISLAKEMAAKGVIVNAVAPGFINTDMYAAVPAEKQAASINTRIPMHRLGEPEELAAVVNFLSGPDVTFLTGQTLVVSGGHMTH